MSLYHADAGQPEAHPNLQAVLTRPIDWQLIRQQYDQKIKYATATFGPGGDAWSPKRRTCLVQQRPRRQVEHPRPFEAAAL